MGKQIIESNIVGTEELNSCFNEGHPPESTREFYDISKEEYDRVINSSVPISTKIGKKSPCYEAEN